MPRANIVAAVGVAANTSDELTEFAQRLVDKMNEEAWSLAQEMGLELLPLPEVEDEV